MKRLTKRELKQTIKQKYLPIISAVLLFALGITLICVHNIIDSSLGFVAGIVLLCTGIVQLIYGFTLGTKYKDGFYHLIIGGLNTLLGIVLAVCVSDIIVAIAMLCVLIMINAILEFTFTTYKSFSEIPFFAVVTLSGIKLALGIITIIKPFGNIEFWVIAVGIFFVLYASSVALTCLFAGQKND